MVDKKGFDIVRSGCGGVGCLSFQPSMFYSVLMQSYELNCCLQSKIATNVVIAYENLDFFLFFCCEGMLFSIFFAICA